MYKRLNLRYYYPTSGSLYTVSSTKYGSMSWRSVYSTRMVSDELAYVDIVQSASSHKDRM